MYTEKSGKWLGKFFEIFWFLKIFTRDGEDKPALEAPESYSARYHALVEEEPNPDFADLEDEDLLDEFQDFDEMDQLDDIIDCEDIDSGYCDGNDSGFDGGYDY